MTLPYKIALGLALAVFAATLWARWSGRLGETVAAADTLVAVDKVAAEAGQPAVRTSAETDRLAPLVDPAETGLDATGGDASASPEVPAGLAETVEPTRAIPTLTIGRNPFVHPFAENDSHASEAGAAPIQLTRNTVVERRPGDIAPVPSNTAETYTVRPGDTFEKIAAARYGAATRWVDIAQANPLVDPIRLRVGQTLRLPDVLAGATRQPDPDPTPARPGDVDPVSDRSAVVHEVQAGDSLSTIASRYYGDSTLWRHIFTANQSLIGTNPHAVRVGMKLTIPPSPRTASRVN